MYQVDDYCAVLCDKVTKLDLTTQASNVYLTVLFKQQTSIQQ